MLGQHGSLLILSCFCLGLTDGVTQAEAVLLISRSKQVPKEDDAAQGRIDVHAYAGGVFFFYHVTKVDDGLHDASQPRPLAHNPTHGWPLQTQAQCATAAAALVRVVPFGLAHLLAHHRDSTWAGSSSLALLLCLRGCS